LVEDTTCADGLESTELREGYGKVNPRDQNDRKEPSNQEVPAVGIRRLAEIRNSIFPDYSLSAQELKAFDDNLDQSKLGHCHFHSLDPVQILVLSPRSAPSQYRPSMSPGFSCASL